MRSGRRGGRAGAIGAIAIAIAACSSSKALPVPDLAESLHAQEEFQPIRAKWEHTDTKGRVGLRPALERYVRVHPQDPTTRTATAMLALATLLDGDVEKGGVLAARLMIGAEGASKDMAIVTLGAVARRKGHAKDALKLLEPLFGKVLDPCARGVLNEEIVVAAIDAGKLDDAVKYLRGWIVRANDEERDEVEARVTALIAKLPKDPLVGLVESAYGTDEMKSPLLRIAAKRLSAIAIETRDGVLARLLVTKAGPILGDQADEVARVAAKTAAIHLETNTVGLLLSQRGEEQRRRSLDVAQGLALALGLPGSTARLVSRDDQGDPAKIDEALALLNADGAAVIVAGIDARESNAAFDYAERTGVPIVLLRPPDRILDPAGHVFVVGDAPLASRTALVDAAIRGGKGRVALIVGDRSESDAPPAGTDGGVVAVQPCGAPLDFARAAGATALLVDAGPVCTREAADGSSLTLALGLDAPASLDARFRARAGRFPIGAGTGGGDADLATFFERSSEPPSWWAGLGHDAGKLAWAAVSALPSKTATDSRAIAARKETLTGLVAAANEPLWTTTARGFAGGRALARDITVEERKTPEARERRAPSGPRAPKR